MPNFSDGNGTKIFIGPQTTSDDPSTYSSGITWTEVKECEAIPEFGDQSAIIAFNSLTSGRAHKRKGTADSGDLTVTFGMVANDPGQLAMTAASKLPWRYPFKIVIQDGLDANDTDGTFYFGALVNGNKVNVGQSNAINKRSYNLVIDTPIHEVPMTVVP